MIIKLCSIQRILKLSFSLTNVCNFLNLQVHYEKLDHRCYQRTYHINTIKYTRVSKT